MSAKNRKKNEEVVTRYINSEAPPNLLLDVGVGPKSEYLTLLDHYPSMRAVGLEPYVPLFNELKHVFPGLLLPYAASDSDEAVEFFVNEKNPEASGIVPYDKEYSSECVLRVPAITLDWLDTQLCHPERILFWMDIEGAEMKALEGARNLFSSGRVRWVNIEAREKWNGKSGGCLESTLDDFFRTFGFVKYLIYNHVESTGHHDIIYVHNEEVIPTHGLETSKKHYLKVGSDYTQSYLAG